MKVGLIDMEDSVRGDSGQLELKWNNVDYMLIDKYEACDLINHLVNVFGITFDDIADIEAMIHGNDFKG